MTLEELKRAKSQIVLLKKEILNMKSSINEARGLYVAIQQSSLANPIDAYTKQFLDSSRIRVDAQCLSLSKTCDSIAKSLHDLDYTAEITGPIIKSAITAESEESLVVDAVEHKIKRLDNQVSVIEQALDQQIHNATSRTTQQYRGVVSQGREQTGSNTDINESEAQEQSTFSKK